MQRINAWVAQKGEAGPTLAWTELGEGDLMAGNVTIRVSHSTSTTRTPWPSPARHPSSGAGQ